MRFRLARSRTPRGGSAAEEAVARERARWASELHDGLLQSLASVTLQIEVCLALADSREPPDIPSGDSGRQLRRELARTKEFLGQSVREARRLLVELKANARSTENFLPWLREHAARFERRYGIRVAVSIEGEGELERRVTGDVIRIVREALTNVRKHARTRAARVLVSFSAVEIAISVSDDGIGFDVRRTLERSLDSSHHGLIGMRFRAESIGGTLTLSSEPGRGTTVALRLPRVSTAGGAEGARPPTPRSAPATPNKRT